MTEENKKLFEEYGLNPEDYPEEIRCLCPGSLEMILSEDAEIPLTPEEMEIALSD